MTRLLSGQLDLVLARDEGRSLVSQICEQFRGAMLQGLLPAGTTLPSSRELADMLGVARNTVSTAFEQLAMEGFIDVRQGRRPVAALPQSLEGQGGASVAASHHRGLRASRWAAGIRTSGWPFAPGPDEGALATGLADGREFDHDLWARCLRSGARRALPAGGELNDLGLRKVLLTHLARERGVRAEARQVFLLPSAQAGLALCARLVLNPLDRAWMESPGYPGARAALLGAHARVSGIAVDSEGMAFGRRRDRPSAIFVTPSHQYPTGVLMSVARRQGLLQLARRCGAAIIEDDYDSEFHYDGKPVAALQGLDASGSVFYVGTFSKAMFNGVRVGYVVVPEAFVGLFEQAQRHTGLLVSPVLQSGLAIFIGQGHFAAHVRRMNRIYRARRDYLVEQLDIRLRDRLRVQVPPGGMQLLARLITPDDDVEIVRRLAARRVNARALSLLYVGRAGPPGLFLGFASSTPTEMSVALTTLVQCLRD